jgi:hypothetical protein
VSVFVCWPMNEVGPPKNIQTKFKGEGAMDGRTTLGNALAGFAVGLFVHAIPGSWWPRWLRELVGKDE